MKTTAPRAPKLLSVKQPSPWQYLARPDLRRALAVVEGVFQKGAQKHPLGDGFEQSATFHVEHAVRHLWAVADGDRILRIARAGCCWHWLRWRRNGQ